MIAANSAWNILNFRKPLITALREDDWRVVALAPPDESVSGIRALGADFVPISLDSSGTSIIRDLRSFLDYFKILRRLQPQAFLGFTVKPNIYGSLAARMLGIRVINNISGLGTAFMKEGTLNRLVSRLYRLALRRSSRVFFQNRHDRQLFVDRALVSTAQAQVLPGSGVDLDHFTPAALPAARPFRFLFIGRLLKDKGLVEYAEAARLLRQAWPEVEFAVLGFVGADNRSAVPRAELERWQCEGLLNYLGETDDVRPFIANSHCVVLPSYREGLPRSLLESAAMERPMIATNVPGCSDVVADGENGFLCAPRSAPALASAMEAMLRLPATERTQMGRKAREIVERDFDQKLIVDAYRAALQ